MAPCSTIKLSTGLSGITGRMLPQPRVETADGRTVLLDDLLGRGFALVAYGPNAQATLASLDIEMAAARRVALLPSDMNPDPAHAETIWARDAGQLFDTFLAGVEDVVMLVRPDRYVAVAAPRHAQDAFVGAIEDLFARAGVAASGTPRRP